MASSVSPFMAQALELARRALGAVSPNPAVGAVIVGDGRVVGRGHTQPPGQAHAEVMALQEAGLAAAGATLYVTLEPCAHFGRTPPCTDAIIAARIREVHVATPDPNPRTDGQGIAKLRAAGIAVTVGDGEEAARRVTETFAKHVTTGMPFVIAKFAVSLDGKTATRTGDARWISGEASRLVSHRLRAEADAVMVGIGTALKDDPRLTAREVRVPAAQQPLRVVVDSSGRLPVTAAMLREPGRTLVAVAHMDPALRTTLADAGAETMVVPGSDGRVDLRALLEALGARDVTSVLVEGGATLLGGLFDAHLVDKVVVFVAPVVIGGDTAPAAVAGHGALRIADALRLREVQYEQMGPDMMVTGYPLP